MPISLYDAVVPSNLQILGAIDAACGKAQAFCAEHGRAEADLIDARLSPDMLPLGFQIKSCVGHSAGAIAAIRTGTCSPDLTPWANDFAGLRAALQGAIAALQAIDRDAFEAQGDGDTQFVFGERKMPFTSVNFLLSFAQPNFYFHASIAYAILRAQGVQIGKGDFVGQLRMKV